MPDIEATVAHLPAGGGGFELPRLTIGIFRNDQPGHRLAVGRDRVTDYPLIKNQGWILPEGATGICEYDAPLEVSMIGIDRQLLLEAGMTNLQDFAPVIGNLDPLVLQLGLAADDMAAGGLLYQQTMHRALAAQVVHAMPQPVGNLAQIGDLRLRRVMQYIHDNLAEDLSLEIMADLAAMSSFHFARAFKKATGKSPLQYVLAQRIAMAKVLLKTTGLSISEICYRIGYTDLSRFGQHFKRATGTTPARFRAG